MPGAHKACITGVKHVAVVPGERAIPVLVHTS